MLFFIRPAALIAILELDQKLRQHHPRDELPHLATSMLFNYRSSGLCLFGAGPVDASPSIVEREHDSRVEGIHIETSEVLI